MLSKEAAATFFNQIMELWVNLEITRRKHKKIWTEGYQINKCLITFPKGKSPIVKFNGEVRWVALVKKAPGTSFQKGQTVYIYEVEYIKTVKAPTYKRKPVAFVYFFREIGNDFRIFFDFTPNWPQAFVKKKEGNTAICDEIAKSMQAKLVEGAVHIQESFQTQLQKIGLWTAPAITPYPLSKIVFLLERDNIKDARLILLNHCTPEFLEKLSNKWWDVKGFSLRRPLIEPAIVAHQEGKYVLSIPALLPHVEGIISDWAYSQKPEGFPWRTDSKTRKFRDIVLKKPTPFSYDRIVNSAVNFILEGPVLRSFTHWVDEIDEAFPNRHVVEHGKYDPSLFTEENSIKLLLLIDTLHYIISRQLE